MESSVKRLYKRVIRTLSLLIRLHNLVRIVMPRNRLVTNVMTVITTVRRQPS